MKPLYIALILPILIACEPRYPSKPPAPISEWVEVTQDGYSTILVHTSSKVELEPQKIRVWVIVNFKKPEVWIDDKGTEKPYNSSKGTLLFDCQKQTYAAAEMRFYEGQNAEGGIVHTFDDVPSKAKVAEPGTPSYPLYEFVCGTKKK